MADQTRAQAIHGILTAVYGQSPWSLEQIVADMDKPETDYFVVQDKGEVVGFLSTLLLVGELEITNIAVHPDVQGRGLADQLMTQLDTEHQPIFLEVRASNQRAQRLYKKYGFEPVGRRKNYYHNPTEDAVLMVKNAD